MNLSNQIYYKLDTNLLNCNQLIFKSVDVIELSFLLIM